MGFLIAAQFLMNPVILLGCLYLVARKQNEMKFLGALLACTCAMTVTVLLAFKFQGELSQIKIALISVGTFFGILLFFVQSIGKVDLWRGVLAVVLFCGFRLAIEITMYTQFIRPVVEASGN